MLKSKIVFTWLILTTPAIFPQVTDPFNPDFNAPREIDGMILVWNDEFNNTGKPDTSFWVFEKGFVRNNELQWYGENNALCRGGILLIEGRREKVANPGYTPGSNDWRRSREFAEYTSSSIRTRGKKEWQYGRFEIRARIDTACGSWPAVWTLGIKEPWPANGEIDIMEFYRIKGIPTILGNFAWGTEERGRAKWDDMKIPLDEFTGVDPGWVNKFHIWRMEWDENAISIYLDDRLINDVRLKETVNPDGFNPFRQPHYLVLNLAIGANGGDPSASGFPIKYEIDYVRVYQKK
ncbi:MAG: glycoside hydrolase family 16 protein [Bacteroidales bacterium]|nr:glycoside hydrolase family 16 protein [Bacteroidales bacterium]